MGAVSFIETMDHTSLSNITQEEFETHVTRIRINVSFSNILFRNVEAAIEALPEEGTPSPPLTANLTTFPRLPPTPRTPVPSAPNSSRTAASPLAGEEAAEPLSLPIPSGSRVGQSGPSQLAEDTRRFFQRTSDTISKPLSAIGRIFSEVLDDVNPTKDKDDERRVGWRNLPGPFAPFSVRQHQQEQAQGPPATPANDPTFQPPLQTPYRPRVRPGYSNSPSGTFVGTPDYTPTQHGQPFTNQPLVIGTSQPYLQTPTPVGPIPPAVPQAQRQLRVEPSPHPSRNPTPTLDFTALQDEIDRAHLAAQDAARETLMQIFPTVEKEVAEMVLEANDGDLGRSIEGLLEISGQSVEEGAIVYQ